MRSAGGERVVETAGHWMMVGLLAKPGSCRSADRREFRDIKANPWWSLATCLLRML